MLPAAQAATDEHQAILGRRTLGPGTTAAP